MTVEYVIGHSYFVPQTTLAMVTIGLIREGKIPADEKLPSGF